MNPRRQNRIFWLIAGLPALLTMIWTTGPALKAATATMLFNPKSMMGNNDGAMEFDNVDVRRRIQKHFLGLEYLAHQGVRRYVGSTDTCNEPMIAVFRANDCEERGTRRQYRLSHR